MLVEALILGSHRAAEHILADLIELNRIPVLKLELREQRGPIARVYLGGLRRIECICVGVVRQILEPSRAEGVHADAAGDHDGGEHSQNGEKTDRGMLLFNPRPIFHRT